MTGYDVCFSQIETTKITDNHDVVSTTNNRPTSLTKASIDPLKVWQCELRLQVEYAIEIGWHSFLEVSSFFFWSFKSPPHYLYVNVTVESNATGL